MSKKNSNYQEAITELEAIVSKLENEEADIDQLSALTARATELISICKEKLRSTEESLKSIKGEG